jgi:hypothetical protein
MEEDAKNLAKPSHAGRGWSQWKKMQKTWPNPLMLEGVDRNGRQCKKHGQTLSCWKGLIAMEEDAQRHGQAL